MIVPPAPSVPGPQPPACQSTSSTKPQVTGVLVDLERQAPSLGVLSPRRAGRPRVPRRRVPRVRGVLVGLGSSGPQVLSVLVDLRSSGPRRAGRPRVLGSPACWSTSSAEPRGPHPPACRSASSPGSPGSPGPPVPGVLVGLASRVALSPGPRSPLCRSTSSPTSPSRHLPRACWSTSKRLDLGASGRPRQREGAAGRPSPPQERTGGAQGRPTRASRPPLPRPASPGKGRTGTHGPATPRPRASPSGKGGHAAAPPTPPARRRHGHDPTGSSFPVPARGPKAPARRRAGGSQAARKRADAPGGAPPLSPRGPNALPPPLKAAPRPSFPKGRDAHAFPPPPGRPGGRPSERGGTRARDPPTAPSRGAGEGGRGRPGGGARGPGRREATGKNPDGRTEGQRPARAARARPDPFS